LSTVSTYLARLTERGFLERVKGQGFIRYRLARSSEIQE
jgi:predicted transcriptional regulator